MKNIVQIRENLIFNFNSQFKLICIFHSPINIPLKIKTILSLKSSSLRGAFSLRLRAIWIKKLQQLPVWINALELSKQ